MRIRESRIIAGVPPLPPAGDVLRIALQFTQESKTFGCRFFVSYSGGTPSAADCTALANEVASAWGTQFSPLQSTAVSLTEVTVEDLSSDTANFGTWAGTTTGTRSGTAAPMSICLRIDFTLARKYRGGKPKIFLPLGVDSDIYEQTSWLAAFTGPCGTAWEAFINAILATSGISISPTAHVNVSYYSGFTSAQNPVTKRYRNIPTLRATPVVSTITSHIAQGPFGSQRKRLKLKV